MAEHVPVHAHKAPESVTSEQEGHLSQAPPTFQLQAGPGFPSGDPDQEQHTPIGVFSGPDSIPDDSAAPNLADYKGADIGLPGRISAPGAHIADALLTGMNIRRVPDPSATHVIGQLKYDTHVTVQAANQDGGWYYVIADNGAAGWINRDFVALNPPDPSARLHHVTEPDLTTILKREYVDKGLWDLETGSDYTALAAALLVANKGRAGISINLEKREAYKDDNPVRDTLDPASENFADYASADIQAGANIWLPGKPLIQQMQETGQIAGRAEWMNAALEVGDAIGGFTAGYHAGIFGSIWDTLVGLYETGKAIVGVVKDAFTKEFWANLSEVYGELKAAFDKLRGMSAEQLRAWASDLISQFSTAISGAAEDFVAQWNHPDAWKSWFFRGKVIGQICLEVVLAIFTVGAGTAVKWVGTIGKFSPKLARIIAKGIQKADDLLPSNLRRGMDKAEDGLDRAEDRVDDLDTSQLQAYTLAKSITEMHDAQDSPVPVLKGALAGISKTYGGKVRYEVEPKAEVGHYRVIQLKRKEVDGDYTPKKGHSYPDFDEDSVHHNEFRDKKKHRTEVAEAEWSNHGNKHKKAQTEAQAKAFSHEESQYLPSINNKQLEKLATQKGIVRQKPGNKSTNYYFFKSDRIVGYDRGKPTCWIRAEVSSGTYHGHPIGPDRLYSQYGIK